MNRANPLRATKGVALAAKEGRFTMQYQTNASMLKLFVLQNGNGKFIGQIEKNCCNRQRNETD